MATSSRARTGLSIFAFAVSGALLIATSQDRITLDAEQTVSGDFTLQAGETVAFTVQIEHADLGEDVDGSIELRTLASTWPLDGDTTLTVTLADPATTDTGFPADGTIASVSGADGVGVLTSGDFPLDTSPILTLTAGKAGGVEGSVEVDVYVEWYTEEAPSPDTLLTVTLVEAE